MLSLVFWKLRRRNRQQIKNEKAIKKIVWNRNKMKKTLFGLIFLLTLLFLLTGCVDEEQKNINEKKTEMISICIGEDIGIPAIEDSCEEIAETTYYQGGVKGLDERIQYYNDIDKQLKLISLRTQNLNNPLVKECTTFSGCVWKDLRDRQGGGHSLKWYEDTYGVYCEQAYITNEEIGVKEVILDTLKTMDNTQTYYNSTVNCSFDVTLI